MISQQKTVFQCCCIASQCSDFGHQLGIVGAHELTWMYIKGHTATYFMINTHLKHSKAVSRFQKCKSLKVSVTVQISSIFDHCPLIFAHPGWVSNTRLSNGLALPPEFDMAPSSTQQACRCLWEKATCVFSVHSIVGLCERLRNSDMVRPCFTWDILGCKWQPFFRDFLTWWPDDPL